jgi:arylsulfatase A-like enzyme
MPRIVIAAFDGLQPSQVSPDRMPVVSKLADNGVRFAHNHGVFPTVTRANSASLVTGVTPGTHGLTANKSIFPEYSKTDVVDALIPWLPEINQLTGGNLLFVPTLGEMLSDQGMNWVSVVGGTSGNAFVHHPNAGTNLGTVIHPEFTNPPEHHEAILGKFGEWPAKEAPAADLVVHTADVAIQYALGELKPDVLLVWFPEPDTSQHAYGIDSPEAQEMYSLADTQLGRILDAVKVEGEDPEVFVVSDHGYSTIDTIVDVQGELTNAGFGPDDKKNPVVLAENGGSLLLYLPETREDKESVEKLLGWLDDQEWVGAIASDLPNAGNVEHASLADIGLQGSRSPDIVVAMRSSDTGQSAPLARSGAAASGRRIGVGSHGGGSTAEMHNTLIASGPSFVSGLNSEIPSGNIDVAPTVMALLDIPVPDHFDGRVLTEALRANSGSNSSNAVSEQSKVSADSPTVIAATGTARYLCEFG